METAANQLRTPDLAPDGPTYEDGNIPSPAPEAPPAPRSNQDNGEERAEPQPWKDDKRNEIFSRAREKRLEETQPFSGDPNDPAALYGSEADQSDLGELEKEALRRRQEHLGQVAQPGQQPQQGQTKPLNGIDPQFLAQGVPIIVDGQQREVPIEELVRNYQIDQAATKRLEQAKALLAQTQEFQRYQQPQPGYDNTGYDEPSGQDDSAGYRDNEQGADYTGRSPVNVKDLVEKIQLGTPDEAAQALEEFVSSAVNRAPAVDETTRVLTALEDHNAKQAVLSFAEKNPQIATNPTVQAEATRQIHRAMAEDLLRAGYSMDQLRQAAPSPESLTQLHKQARVQGLRGVRQVSELVSAGYQGALQNLRSIVEQTAPQNAQPNQAPGMQQRQQRKESLQPQPVARRLSPSMSASQPAKTQDQSRFTAVQKMRQARGQPT
jgi:hypothetical protein